MDTLDFSTNKDVSAHIDIAAWQDRRTRVHRLHRLPGNRLDIYHRRATWRRWRGAGGHGPARRVVVIDMAGNVSTAEVQLIGDSLRLAIDTADSPCSTTGADIG